MPPFRRLVASALALCLAFPAVPAAEASRITRSNRIAAPNAVPALPAVPVLPTIAAQPVLPAALGAAQRLAAFEPPAAAQRRSGESDAALQHQLWDRSALPPPSVAAGPASPGEPALVVSRAAAIRGLIRPPPARAARLLQAGYWAGLNVAAVSLHAPVERPAPLLAALVIAPIVTLAAVLWLARRRPMAARGPRGPIQAPPTAGELRRLHSLAHRAAEELRIPPPRKIDAGRRELGPQAVVEGFSTERYRVSVSPALLRLRPIYQLAWLRHELAHVKHRDSLFHLLRLFAAPMAAMIALASGDAAAFAALGGALLAYPYFNRLDEYQADQEAAARRRGGGALARFFAEHPGEPPRALSAWTHPSRERRLARLKR